MTGESISEIVKRQLRRILIVGGDDLVSGSHENGLRNRQTGRRVRTTMIGIRRIGIKWKFVILILHPGMDGPYGRTQLTYPVTHFIRACVWIGSNECEGPDTGQRPKVSLTLRF